MFRAQNSERKYVDQRADVLQALAKRGHRNGHDAQPIVEILSETARRDELVEPAVRRRDDADADADRLLAADALQLAVLQDAEQLRLRRLVQVADLVEEDRPAVGQLEPAAPQRRRAGERPLLVAEQLALDQLGRDGRAVDLDERPGRERTLPMDVRGEQFLARARLADEQHADVRSRHLRGLIDGVPERRARADHPRRLADQLAEALVLALQLGSLERVLGDEQHPVARERLLEKIERAASRRLHRIADGAVPGDHHRRRRVVTLPQRPQQVDAVAVGQTDVEQVQIGAALAPLGMKLRRRLADRDG